MLSLRLRLTINEYREIQVDDELFTLQSTGPESIPDNFTSILEAFRLHKSRDTRRCRKSLSDVLVMFIDNNNILHVRTLLAPHALQSRSNPNLPCIDVPSFYYLEAFFRLYSSCNTHARALDTKRVLGAQQDAVEVGCQTRKSYFPDVAYLRTLSYLISSPKGEHSRPMPSIWPKQLSVAPLLCSPATTYKGTLFTRSLKSTPLTATTTIGSKYEAEQSSGRSPRRRDSEPPSSCRMGSCRCALVSPP